MVNRILMVMVNKIPILGKLLYSLRKSYRREEIKKEKCTKKYKLLKDRNTVGMKLPQDQWGSTTYMLDLAGVIVKIIEDDSVSYGVYHFTNEGMTSWYEFSWTIYEKAKRLGLIESNKKVEIQPIMTEEYPTAAKKPRYSYLKRR